MDLIFEPISEVFSWIGGQILTGLVKAFGFLRSKFAANGRPAGQPARVDRSAPITAKRR